MIIRTRGGQLWPVLLALGAAAAIAGCTATGDRPTVSTAKAPSAVVPEAVAQFSTPPRRVLGIASSAAQDLPATDRETFQIVTRQTPQSDESHHSIASTTPSDTSAAPDASRVVRSGRTLLESESVAQPDSFGVSSARPTDSGIHLMSSEDGELQPLRLIPSEVELGDSASSEAIPSSQVTELPVPEPVASPSGTLVARDPSSLFQNQIPIDLASALQLTAGQNPQVGFAQQRIQEAYAQLRLAEVLWVPSIRAGVNYNKHDGVIQDVAGNMVSNSRSSVYTGLGAQAVGAGSPAVPGLVMNFHLRDAIFRPRIAEQALGARQQASRAATNDVLLETALRYMDLLEAIQILAIAEESLQNAKQLSQLTKSFAEAGEGLQADADRASTELSVRQIEVRRAVENVRVASIRLARVLSQQDQSLTLVPQEPALIPIDLVVPSSELSELVATGLANRPELTESRYLVGEAVERLRREVHAPLVPSVLLGMSYGGNGGSPTSTITDFGDRVDFDAAIYWEVRNFGFGEQYARNGARSQMEQARFREVQVMDQVASEVAESHAQVEARQSQIEIAEAGITAARDSYRRNVERIRDGQGLPIETLQSIQALDQARRQYVRAVADYNRAQFQLQRALGWPIQ